MTQSFCVASVPAAHPYVERALASSGSTALAEIGLHVTVLPDPRPEGAPAGQWWPPVILSPGWIDGHQGDAELLHIHFGTESYTVDELVAAVDAAHRAGWPVVQTVHDLVNPQLVDQDRHLAQLDAVLPLVDAVITLTPGAAAEIEARWGRSALVLPHPRLLPDDVEPPRGLTSSTPLIGMHLKDLRPSVDGPAAVRRLLAALDALRAQGKEAAGEVRLHRHVRDEAQRRLIRELCADRDDVVLLEHDRLDDRALAHTLSHLDVCVLPYRSGTHSGWLELCWDLGVAVAVPDIGFFAEQHDDPTVASFAGGSGADVSAIDGDSLADALNRLLDVAPRSGTDARRLLATERLRARAVTDAETARAHAQLYRDLLAGRPRP